MKIDDESAAMTAKPQIFGDKECSFDDGVSEEEKEVELAIHEATTSHQKRQEENMEVKDGTRNAT